MKILHITKYYYPQVGGIEQVTKDIVMALGRNVEQEIIAFSANKDTYSDIVDGVLVYRCGVYCKIASQPISVDYCLSIKKEIDKFKPEIIFLHYPNPLASVFLLAVLPKNTKLVVYWHSDIVAQKITGSLFFYHNIKLLKRANVVVATSPNYIIGSKYLTRFKNKCRVIPCCIDTRRISIDKIEYNNNSDNIIFFAFGRHVEYKGFEYLIRSCAKLCFNYKLYLCGSGPLTERLKSLAKNNNHIVFLGKLNDSELIKYISKCDIFCFPSITRNEAFGIALAEAMYCGKPCITFSIRGSGVNYVCPNNISGIEVLNGDVDEYAQAMTFLAENPEKRKFLGIEGRKRVIKKFSFNIFCDHINNLINSL